MNQLFIIICLMFSSLVFSSDSSARYAYLNKNYKTAKMNYLDLIKSNPHNFSYHYNLGATYFRLNDLVNAKLYFLKALKLNPSNKDTKFNLEVINKKLIDQNLFFKSHWNHVFGISIKTILSIMLIGTIPILLLFLMMIKRKTKNILYRPMIVFCFIWFSALFSIFFLKINQSNYGLITTKKVSVYSGPSKTQKVLFYAHQGAEFKISRFSSEWYQIQFSNGLKGWIKGIDLELI